MTTVAPFSAIARTSFPSRSNSDNERPAAGSSSSRTFGRPTSARDLEQSLLTVRRLARQRRRSLGKTHEFEVSQRIRARSPRFCPGARQPQRDFECAGALAWKGSEQHIVEHSLVIEQFRRLECAADAQPRDRVRAKSEQVAAAEPDRARACRIIAADDIEQRRLA